MAVGHCNKRSDTDAQSAPQFACLNIAQHTTESLAAACVARPEPSHPCEPRGSARTPEPLELLLRLPYRYRTTTCQGFTAW